MYITQRVVYATVRVTMTSDRAVEFISRPRKRDNDRHGR